MTTLYRLLNTEAKRWWYHAQLREHGATQEARKRERNSIKSTLKTIREAKKNDGFLTLGRGGFTLHYSTNARLEGYDCDHWLQVANVCKLPTIDSRSMPIGKVLEALRLPMASVGSPDNPDYLPEAFQSKPYREIAAQWERLGAKLYNF